jgi:predicted nucleic acid-binding protein
MEYLLDSNVVIDYLAGRFKDNALTQIRSIVNSNLRITTITKIEVLGFTSGIKELDAKAEGFVSLAILYDLSNEVVEQTIKIRKSYKIKIADAIIAATAITHNLTLLSGNTKDFIVVNGVKIIDPYTL